MAVRPPDPTSYSGTTVFLTNSNRVMLPDGRIIPAQVWDATSTFPTMRYMDPESLCPDLLSLDYIGPADHMRGRVVRAFFWLMRVWPKVRHRGH